MTSKLTSGASGSRAGYSGSNVLNDVDRLGRSDHAQANFGLSDVTGNGTPNYPALVKAAMAMFKK